MIQTIIFSKNRPAQLDLLLRSANRAYGILTNIHVLYDHTNQNFNAGYLRCIEQHKTVTFTREFHFQEQLFSLLLNGDSTNVVFLCDDDIVTRPFMDVAPDFLFSEFRELLCVSLRLGMNTTYCYPLKRNQRTPNWKTNLYKSLLWEWEGSECDWGYPGSLDGHIFNRNLLRAILSDAKFSNPNELEESLAAACEKLSRSFPLMACYESSFITGNPINRVNTTHPNRFGDSFYRDEEELNQIYLRGKRIDLDSVDRSAINGAHTELELSFS